MIFSACSQQSMQRAGQGAVTGAAVGGMVTALVFGGNVGEAEVRWGFTPRWILVGFGGVGRAINDNARFNSQETVYTKGAGLRYFLSRRFGLHSGFDVAWGPEETAFYITFGSAWAK